MKPPQTAATTRSAIGRNFAGKSKYQTAAKPPARKHPPISKPTIMRCDDIARVKRHQLTAQAQRPGARDAMIATTTLPPDSLQRMVSPHHRSNCECDKGKRHRALAKYACLA